MAASSSGPTRTSAPTGSGHRAGPAPRPRHGLVRLDTTGRLLDLVVRPGEALPHLPEAAPPDWDRLLAEAGLLRSALVTRFGLLAMAVVAFVGFLEIPAAWSLNAWHAPTTLFAWALVVGLALFGAWAALGRRRLLSPDLLD